MLNSRINIAGFLLMLILVACQIDDTNSPAPGDTFIKYFGTDGSQVGKGIINLESEGNFLIYGTQNSAEDGTTANLYMLRVDDQGNELDEVAIDFLSDVTALNTNAGDDTPGSVIYDER